MTIEDRKLLIARILTPKTSVEADARAIADRVLWSWERMAFHLTPLIGEGGFQSLYLRAIHMALPECPRITLLKHCKSTDDLFQKLREDLNFLDAVTTELCSSVLLNKFIELVSSMIGDSLTGQILHSAWDDPSSQGSTQESAK